MKAKKISQEKIAKAIEVSQKTVSKWVLGQSEATLTNLYNLCIYLDVSADYLLGLKEY